MRAALTDEQRCHVGRFLDVQARLLDPVTYTAVEFPRSPRPPAAPPKPPRSAIKRMTQDAGWFQRQVDYLRQLADDLEHQGRYLRGIAICWGEEERKRVEEAL